MNPLALVRSLIMALLFPLFTVICSILGILEVLFFNNRKMEDRLVWFWTGGALKMFGISVIEKGRENIPDSSCLFLFNHTSFFDIFVLNHQVPHVRFGAKIELFKIPFFGRAMKHFGILPIRRANKEDVFKVYDEAIERTVKGEQFALAPEGGRNKEEKLLPFKSGPFVFAINSKIPVVPVVIKNASHVMPKGSYIPNARKWSDQITIEFLPPISVTDYTFETRNDLQKKVFTEMVSHF